MQFRRTKFDGEQRFSSWKCLFRTLPADFGANATAILVCWWSFVVCFHINSYDSILSARILVRACWVGRLLTQCLVLRQATHIHSPPVAFSASSSLNLSSQ
ncbi:hypothetical protein P154DRAFT_261811 [Amniculicola lignicola CBS 123094]|uniref:Uncharacterized protein n=1 Tax=Amniculicola lignicola CBS 123094 TaxID=1392246 RepID=A0A6A5WBJ8_9PLEO|nr:hypothetical protein P154DRAFT_261811 [Amniculicola lignicola CBS 123094]